MADADGSCGSGDVKQVCTKGTQCFAINCTSYKNAVSRSKGLTFHKFPNRQKSPERFRKWVSNCRRQRQPSDSCRLCSKHFEDKCFNRTDQRTTLKPGAVPTQFDVPQRLQPTVVTPRPTRARSAAASSDVIDNESTSESLAQQIHIEHPYSIHDEESAKLKNDRLQTQVEELKKQLKNTKAREQRAKQTSKNLIQQLSDLNFLTAELEAKLTSYKDIPCELFAKPAHQYSEDQRKFALTLHLYSPKAYSYLRDKVKINLPEPRTLRRWLERVDSNPGLNLAIIQALAAKRQEKPEEYTHCALMIDAMAIRKQIQYDARTQCFTGYVDLGDDSHEDGEAKEALVVMLVGLKSKWKAPIAYYLTATLTAEVQSQLVLHSLEKLFELGFIVHTLTMDGHASNRSMVTLLGGNMNIDQLKPWFCIPGRQDKIYIVFDPCHMIKLARNMWQFHGTLRSPDGFIMWNYIRDLNTTQEELGVRFANKLGKHHLEFQQQKMKVSLAVQTLSNSVAVALETMEELQVPNFLGCKPTVEFLKKMDRLFDVMNSKSAYGKGYKRPLSKSNWHYVEPFLSQTKAYLLSLETVTGQPLHSSRRSMCIIGLIINIESLKGLVHELLESDVFKYLLTYKMCQDHIELFFNAVRRCGGWNNNPTALHFKSTFRRLICHAGAVSGDTGNVTTQDRTELFQASNSTYVPPYVEREDIAPADDHDTVMLHDHTYMGDSLGPLVGNILVYIAGWVVRKALQRISCDDCRSALVAQEPCPKYRSRHHFITLRNNGGLVLASEGVLDIVFAAEKHMRASTSVNRINRACTLLSIQGKVLNQLAHRNVFSNEDHARESQVGIDNHYLSTVRMLVEIFFNIRQFHIVRLHNLKQRGKAVRQKLTKSILFMGQ